MTNIKSISLSLNYSVSLMAGVPVNSVPLFPLRRACVKSRRHDFEAENVLYYLKRKLTMLFSTSHQHKAYFTLFVKYISRMLNTKA